jgi:Cys-tRNA(Pro)/Cys-tRNA(Cys) deacylase
MNPTKTNACRQLDALQIAYELRAYEVDPNDLSAPSVAQKIGLPVEQVFKTLLTETVVTSGKPDHLFAVIPGDAELDLKKLAAVSGHKKLDLASLRQVEPLTGYIRGGVTVLAARKPFPAFADETIELHDTISISAGQRGLQILLAPADYLRATQAALADLTKSLILVFCLSLCPSVKPPRPLCCSFAFALPAPTLHPATRA